jgi:hypothetical protein
MDKPQGIITVKLVVSPKVFFSEQIPRVLFMLHDVIVAVQYNYRIIPSQKFIDPDYGSSFLPIWNFLNF